MRVLRSPKAWLVGSPAGPDIGPARPVGGPAASVKGPTGGLAKLRIIHAIRIAEGLSDITARWRGIGRCLQGQEACETARCALKKDPRHRSFTLVVCVVSPLCSQEGSEASLFHLGCLRRQMTTRLRTFGCSALSCMVTAYWLRLAEAAVI